MNLIKKVLIYIAHRQAQKARKLETETLFKMLKELQPRGRKPSCNYNYNMKYYKNQGGFIMRDYKKENEWKKNKYEEVRGNIEKELGVELKEKLKAENISIANWITDCAKKYLKK